MTRAYSNFAIPPVTASSTLDDPDLTLHQQAEGGLPLQLAEDTTVSSARRVTRTQVAAAREQFAATGSVSAAARAAGIAWSTARLLLHHEVAERGGPLEHTWMGSEHLAEMQRLRSEGWSYRKLAEQFGVDRHVLAKHLKRWAADN